jgi:hypothetical protein
VKSMRHDTRARSPAGVFGGKAPLRLGRMRHLRPCAVRHLTYLANGKFKPDSNSNSNRDFCVRFSATEHGACEFSRRIALVLFKRSE